MVAGGLSHGLDGETILTRPMRGDRSFHLVVVHVFFSGSRKVPFRTFPLHHTTSARTMGV